MSAIRQRHFSALAALSVLTIAAMATPAQAQKKSAGADPGPVFEGMLQCRTITDDSARLACFDRQVAAFADAQKTGEVIVANARWWSRRANPRSASRWGKAPCCADPMESRSKRCRPR